METSPGGDRDWERRLSSRLVRRPGAGTETGTPLTLPGQKGPEVVFPVCGEPWAKAGLEEKGISSEVVREGANGRWCRGPEGGPGRREVCVSSGKGRVARKKAGVSEGKARRGWVESLERERRLVEAERGPGESRGGGWRTGPRSSGAERTAERVPRLEGLLADAVRDSGPAGQSGRRLRDVGSEAGEVGRVAAASGCLRH